MSERLGVVKESLKVGGLTGSVSLRKRGQVEWSRDFHLCPQVIVVPNGEAYAAFVPVLKDRLSKLKVSVAKDRPLGCSDCSPHHVPSS